MTSDFPYYLALFGLAFFITVICCCVKLIDIIDRPSSRLNNTMPAWNYANYLQNSPVAILSPQPEPFLRYMVLAENQGLSVEEYLSSTGRPNLYPSTSRTLISQATQASNAHNHPPQPPTSSSTSNLPPVPLPIPSNTTPPIFSIVVPETRTRLPPQQNKGEMPPKYEEVCFDV